MPASCRVDLDDLRRAGKKASDYRERKENVIKGDFGHARTAPGRQKFKARAGAVVELSEC